MYRGFVYRSSTFRSPGGGTGPGVLNCDDLKNYTTPFVLIADTGVDFTLNGQLVDGGTGAYIGNEGYYEAQELDILGNITIKRFCFFAITAVHIIEMQSNFKYGMTGVNNMSRNQSPSAGMMLYCERPVVGKILDDNRVIAGIIWNRNFYKGVADEDAFVKVIKGRSLIIEDNSNSDAILYQRELVI